MTFLYPSTLLLLLFLPMAVAGIIWGERLRRERLRRLRLEVIMTESVWLRRGLWWSAALACLIVALARPVWGVEVLPVPARGVAMMAVLDVSLSMDAEDVLPSRLERAKLDLRRALPMLEGNEVGLVVFAGSAILQLPLTADVRSADAFLRDVTTNALSGQGTNIEMALKTAQAALSASTAPVQIIWVLSDGENQEGSPLLAAGAARAAGIRVDALGYGTPEGAAIPLREGDGRFIGYKEDSSGELVRTSIDQNALRALTDTAAGQYAQADAEGHALDRLVSEWRALGSPSTGGAQTRPREQFPLFAAAGLACLALEGWTVWRSKGRRP